MTTADLTFAGARRRTRDQLGLRLVPLAGAVLVLWAYIGSFYVYKTWYIAMAVVLTAVAMLAAAGAIDMRGVVAASLLPSLFFAVLAAGVVWAEFPGETLRWVAIDLIELFVFILFYIAYRNSGPRAIAAGLVSLSIPAVAMSVIMYRVDPTLTRLAHYSLTLMPTLIPFAWAHMAWSKRRWPAALSIALAFGVLLAARSRAPLAAAFLAAGLSMVVFRANFFNLFRRAFIAALAVAAMIGILLAIQTTRVMVVTTFVRFAHVPVRWGDIDLEPEEPDLTRLAINELAGKLIDEHFPRGIGYMNFLPNFERTFGYAMNLHSTYETWLVEGGLLCSAVALVLLWRHFAALLRAALRLPVREERFFARACLIATIAILLMGLVHQIHQTPALWLLLGFGAGVGADVRRHARA